MATTPKEIIKRASKGIDAEGGFVGFVKNRGIGGILLAMFTVAISGILSAGDVFMKPLGAFGDGLAMLVDATIGGGARLMVAGWNTAIRSIESGLASLFGPFAPAVAMVAVGITVFTFMWFVARIEFSPLSFIGQLRR